MQVSKKMLALGGIAAVTLAAAPAFAHHSFAMFDNQKNVTLDGTVKEFQWTNPHAWILLNGRFDYRKAISVECDAMPEVPECTERRHMRKLGGFRKLPKSGHELRAGGPLPHESASFAFNPVERSFLFDTLLGQNLHWKFALASFGSRFADGLDGADKALRIPRQADGCAELHDGLVVLGRLQSIEHGLRSRCEFFPPGARCDICPVREPSAQYPQHISVDDARKQRMKTIPAGRFGTREEFGRACAFLCSVHAGYITGQNWLMDGGAYPGTF